MHEDRFPEVADYVRAIIDRASERQDFRDLLLRLMGRQGRILCATGPIKWPAFVLYTSRALGGDPEAATIAAGMIELIVGSSDVADDLVDDEWDGRIGEFNRALMASHALTWLGQRSLAELTPILGAEKTCLISGLIAKNVVNACDGEDLDLVLEAKADVTAEDVHQMTMLRSGSVIAMACQVGAAVATDDPQVLSMIGAFGQHIGVIAQLLNDVGGVINGSDLRRRKKTLPVAYALRCAREEGISTVLDWYEGDVSAPMTDERQLAMTIRDLGGLHYAVVVAEAHRRQALAMVRRLMRVIGKSDVRLMRRLVPVVWPDEMKAIEL